MAQTGAREEEEEEGGGDLCTLLCLSVVSVCIAVCRKQPIAYWSTFKLAGGQLCLAHSI